MSFGVVLQIAVERRDQPALGLIDAGLHGRGLSEIALQRDDLQVEAGTAERCLGVGDGRIRAAVIDEHEFPAGRIIGHGSADALDEGTDAFFFVEERHDEGQFDRGGHINVACQRLSCCTHLVFLLEPRADRPTLMAAQRDTNPNFHMGHPTI